MELKLQCHCGQKFKFDLEPVDGRVPFSVQCPTCGTDGTDAANTVLGQMFPQPIITPAVLSIAAVSPGTTGGLRVSHQASTAASPPPMMLPTEPSRYIQKSAMPTAAPRLQGNIFLGALGAFLGAALGVGIVVGLAVAMGFALSLLVILIGLFSGAGARILYRGSDSSLGGVAAIITLIASSGTLFFLFGFTAIMSIMALMISVSTAWKIGSG
ncbi:MAG TPA: hypothetical protein VK530_02100 [Candidatus Acidoferrum sp.]|nr:hypothetical protein [Candidatus Acidoferrum sp.]